MVMVKRWNMKMEQCSVEKSKYVKKREKEIFVFLFTVCTVVYCQLQYIWQISEYETVTVQLDILVCMFRVFI